MARLSRRRPALALSQPESAVQLQEDTRRVLERRDRNSGKERVTWSKVVDPLAATTIGLSQVWANRTNEPRRVLTDAVFTPTTASAANGTNYARFQLVKVPTTNRATRTHVGELTTRTAALYAHSPRPFDLNGQPIFEPGDTLSIQLQKFGTGVITGAGVVTLTLVEG